MSDQISAEFVPHSSPPCEVVIPEPVPAQPARSAGWKAWDTFLERTPETGFMQSSLWVDFRYTCGFENFGLTLTDGDKVVGGAVVLKYYYADDLCFYYIQDGPVLPRDPLLAEEIFQALLETLEERRKSEQSTVSHVRIEPRWVCLPSFVSAFRPVPAFADLYLEVRDTRCINLLPSEEQILAQMKPKGRYNIGIAQRRGVSIIEDSSAQALADFYSIYEETTERQGIESKPPDYFEALMSFFSSSQHASLFFAEYRGTRLATALVIYFGPRATYFYGASRDIHRHVMSPYLLHFEIMRKAKALGHEWYDLWGIAPNDDPDHPWRNLTIFKSKFGGQEVHLVPTLDYIYDPAAYAHYTALSG